MKIKQAFSTALGPVTSNIPMLLMAWLTGSSVSYINLMFTATLINNFVNSLSNVNEVFKKYTSIDKSTILILKVVYLIAVVAYLELQFTNLVKWEFYQTETQIFSHHYHNEWFVSFFSFCLVIHSVTPKVIIFFLTILDCSRNNNLIKHIVCDLF
ncbi:hypothetical protein KM1_252160 [Entamoeba histolytica HM-3:IMSS]|uniref:ER membrane protein complex subunit 4 n=1 Tax=Entamoeba histolytica HM-3:IMSS TaxID=885315 RepID=M7W7Z0_ENTHI|nr:hypothetical protein KM1_252160 [Entamoeba histolytica HM-3:IMSS]